MKSMRSYLPVLLGGALACSACQKDASDPLVAEFAKHDSWVAAAFEDQGIKVRIVEQGEMSLADRLGFVDTFGLYDPVADELSLPVREHVLDGQAIDAVDHELAHVMTDTLLTQGIIFTSRYQGPSFSEISAEMGSIYQRSEFDSLRRLYATDQVVRENLRTMRLIQVLLTAYDDHTTMLDDMGEYARENEKSVRYVENRSELKRRRKYIQKSLDSLQDAFMKIKLPVDSSAIGNPWERRVLTAKYELLVGRSSVFQDIELYCGDVLMAYAKAHDKYFGLRIRGLERKIEEDDDWVRYLEPLEVVKKEFIQVKDAQEDWAVWHSMRRSVSSCSAKLSAFRADIEYESGINGTSGIMEDPMEVFARMIDSLYSLHFGNPTHFQFPLRDSDLVFLEQFRYENRMMFRKGIERYRLGLQMITDGNSPEKVKGLLEHSEGYTYRGTSYHWPKTPVTIRFVK